MLIIYFYTAIIKTLKVKESTKFWKFPKGWNKFPEIFDWKYPNSQPYTSIAACEVQILETRHRCKISTRCFNRGTNISDVRTGHNTFG